MTTLKFGGFWFETGSISWNLVLRCLFLIAFFYLLISNPRWADYNGWLYGAWANRGSETGRLNSHKRTITPKLTNYLDIFNSESSSVHKKSQLILSLIYFKGCFTNCQWNKKKYRRKKEKNKSKGWYQQQQYTIIADGSDKDEAHFYRTRVRSLFTLVTN